MSPKLVLATHNQGKVTELIEILKSEQVFAELDTDTVVSAKYFDIAPPIEDGSSFAENALIKARAIAKATGLPAIADDSGLSVDIMGGAPGIFSARWCGHHGDDNANLTLLLGQLGENLDISQRHAQFICAAALVTPDGEETVCLGEMPGYLALSPKGNNGFGYDPIFIPDDQPTGETRTSAEMSPAEKNSISHRAKALKALTPTIAAALC